MLLLTGAPNLLFFYCSQSSLFLALGTVFVPNSSLGMYTLKVFDKRESSYFINGAENHHLKNISFSTAFCNLETKQKRKMIQENRRNETALTEFY